MLLLWNAHFSLAGSVSQCLRVFTELLRESSLKPVQWVISTSSLFVQTLIKDRNCLYWALNLNSTVAVKRRVWISLLDQPQSLFKQWVLSVSLKVWIWFKVKTSKKTWSLLEMSFTTVFYFPLLFAARAWTPVTFDGAWWERITWTCVCFLPAQMFLGAEL